TGHERAVSAVVVTPDGRHALSGSHDRTLRLWDLTPKARLTTLRSINSRDRTFQLWDLTSGEPLRMFAGHNDQVGAVALTPDGRHALSASSDRTLRLWNLMTGQSIRTLTGHERAVKAVAVTPDGRYALSGSEDRTLRFWEIREGVCRAMVLL